MSKWFTPTWWRYLLEPYHRRRPPLYMIICRARGHPAGEIFFNPTGDEPDHRCKNCGDFIG